jgi:hypothetical protein
MYPYVMAANQHPIGSEFVFRDGEPSSETCFVRLRCHNYGALVAHEMDGAITGNKESGVFYTTIHEYNAAVETNLISDVDILGVVDCDKFTDFSSFVVPMYERRQETKTIMRSLRKDGREHTPEYDEVKLEDMCLKFYLNNAYGKFGQNPRKHRESYITAIGERPDVDGYGDWPVYERGGEYCIWEKQREYWDEKSKSYERPKGNKLRFYNIATAASITGAARAVLLRAIASAIDPIYCDTDSLICKSLSSDTVISATQLGAWDIEKEFDQLLICGRKTYGAKIKGLPESHDDRIMIKSKGVSGVTWRDLERMLHDEILNFTLPGPTLSAKPGKRGAQFYMSRNIRATAPIGQSLINRSLIERKRHVAR